MKTSTLILLLLLLTVTGFTQTKPIGYLVGIDDGTLKGTEWFKTRSLEDVVKSYKYHTGMVLDTTKIFYDGKVYIQYRDDTKIFYCEMKKVTVKNGKVKYIKIKKKEKYLYSPKKKEE